MCTWYLKRSEEGVRSGTGLGDACEQLCGCWERNLRASSNVTSALNCQAISLGSNFYFGIMCVCEKVWKFVHMGVVMVTAVKRQLVWAGVVCKSSAHS